MNRPAPDVPGSSPSHAQAGAQRRLVLLGASNLRMSLPIVLAIAKRMWPGPLEVLGALGHGRSYGMPSRAMFRELPAILDCGLWQALASAPAPAAETLALVTDIGNDVLYGVEPETIATWVEECLARLAGVGARPVITLLPIEAIAALRPAKYYVYRFVAYPSCRLPIDEARRRAYELNDRVAALAERRGAPVVQQSASWYGLDPVHIRRSCRWAAWEQVLAPLAPGVPASARASGRRPLRLGRPLPEHSAMFGRKQHCRQPARRFADGTTLALY